MSSSACSRPSEKVRGEGGLARGIQSQHNTSSICPRTGEARGERVAGRCRVAELLELLCRFVRPRLNLSPLVCHWHHEMKRECVSNDSKWGVWGAPRRGPTSNLVEELTLSPVHVVPAWSTQSDRRVAVVSGKDRGHERTSSLLRGGLSMNQCWARCFCHRNAQTEKQGDIGDAKVIIGEP